MTEGWSANRSFHPTSVHQLLGAGPDTPWIGLKDQSGFLGLYLGSGGMLNESKQASTFRLRPTPGRPLIGLFCRADRSDATRVPAKVPPTRNPEYPVKLYDPVRFDILGCMCTGFTYGLWTS
jgi:hypothetical protein